ncbi:MAG: hypothetical protein K6E93_08970 [Bacteroidales bacterium]|nr:hypothetical protein [Bacteroidales bacterium]
MSRFLGITLVAVLFASCKVDFSPNASWRETPVVYCVLDQDDDTTYVRVQKCFLGEGNQYGYTTIYDSINYPPNALQVRLLGWRASRGAGNVLTIASGQSAPVQVLECNYMEIVKPSGVFNADCQPVYCCRTQGLLDTSLVYQLVVLKRATNDTLATAVTSLVGGLADENNLLVQPTSMHGFQFTNKNCRLEWRALARARKYQPVVRFYYNDFIRTFNGTTYDTTIIRHYLDIEYPEKAPAANENTTVIRMLDQQTFLSSLRNALLGDTVNKIIVDTVDIYIRACQEELSNYLYSQTNSNSINQNDITYTNINGGLGVFSSRRNHLYVRRLTPASGQSSYKKAIKELGLNLN